ncbi:phage tail protein, partial [Escherichia coli]|nr:phage tail protein [Escherichia coli]
SGLRAWIHRARLEKAQRRRNELIAQILAQSESRPLNASEKQALKQLEDQDDAPPH